MLFVQSSSVLSSNTKTTLLAACSSDTVAIACVGDGTYASQSLTALVPSAKHFVVQDDASVRGVAPNNLATLITSAEYATLIQRYNSWIPLV